MYLLSRPRATVILPDYIRFLSSTKGKDRIGNQPSSPLHLQIQQELIGLPVATVSYDIYQSSNMNSSCSHFTFR